MRVQGNELYLCKPYMQLYTYITIIIRKITRNRCNVIEKNTFSGFLNQNTSRLNYIDTAMSSWILQNYSNRKELMQLNFAFLTTLNVSFKYL